MDIYDENSRKAVGFTCGSLSFSAKSCLVGELAVYSASLFRNQLRGIENIYERLSLGEDSALTKKNSAEKASGYSTKAVPDVGRIVSMPFFWGSRNHQDVSRGPFRSSSDWITARLALSENECHYTLAKYPAGADLDSDDESTVDDVIRTLQIINKLKPLLPFVFGGNASDAEPSMMFHEDLSRHNILVSEDGKLTGVVDWECVSALPLWKACYYPSFLKGPPRTTEPDVERCRREANGEPFDLYWEHLWEYEVTIFRSMFFDEMKRLEPGWVEVFDKSQLQQDFDMAVQNCDNEFIARDIDAWINDVNSGKYTYSSFRSLRDRVDGVNDTMN